MDSSYIDICTIDLESDLCVGCSRTLEEISDWNISNNVRKKNTKQSKNKKFEKND